MQQVMSYAVVTNCGDLRILPVIDGVRGCE